MKKHAAVIDPAHGREPECAQPVVALAGGERRNDALAELALEAAQSQLKLYIVVFRFPSSSFSCKIRQRARPPCNYGSRFPDASR